MEKYIQRNARFLRGKNGAREKRQRRGGRLRVRRLFSRWIYEDPSLAFIETSGEERKGEGGQQLDRACETLACAYACFGILGTQ